MPAGHPQIKTDEFRVTVVCDGLHPDDIEELQRSLTHSRYNFKVHEDQRVQTEDSPGLIFISVHRKLLVRFSAKWLCGRTRRGGVKAIVKAIDDVLEISPYNRDLKPKLNLTARGEEVITVQEWLRPRRKQESWGRGEKIAAWSLLIGVVAAVAAVLVVPEIRRLLRLDKPETIRPVEQTKATPSQQSIPPAQKSEPLKETTPKRTSRTPSCGEKGLDYGAIARGLQEPKGAPYGGGCNEEWQDEEARLNSLSLTQIRAYLATTSAKLSAFENKWQYPVPQSLDPPALQSNGQESSNDLKDYWKRQEEKRELEQDTRPKKRFNDFQKLFPKLPVLIAYLREKWPDIQVPNECSPENSPEGKMYEFAARACAEYLNRAIDKYPRPQ